VWLVIHQKIVEGGNHDWHNSTKVFVILAFSNWSKSMYILLKINASVINLHFIKQMILYWKL